MLRIALPLAGVCLLALVSLLTGVSDVTLAGLADPEMRQVFLVSRVPRTLALILAGAAMAVSGLILQMLTRNRYVEPSIAGTSESAVLGLLLVGFHAPDLGIPARMLVAAVFALGGTGLFLAILRQVPLRSPLVVPLVGIMLSGVIGSVTAFFAYRHDLMQSLVAWSMGDFSGVLSGRYELLWIAAGLTVLAYVAADRFTVAGLGEAFTTNLGVNHRQVMRLGLVIVAVVTAAVIVTCGMIPFLGLVVPNVVSLIVGDNLRRALPWVAALGAMLVLACDIVGRLIIHPYEIPIGTTMGVIGSGAFLALLLRGKDRAG